MPGWRLLLRLTLSPGLAPAEFVASEALHYLGVPTTRALSLVGTGAEVVRDMFYKCAAMGLGLLGSLQPPFNRRSRLRHVPQVRSHDCLHCPGLSGPGC